MTIYTMSGAGHAQSEAKLGIHTMISDGRVMVEMNGTEQTYRVLLSKAEALQMIQKMAAGIDLLERKS